MSDPWLKFYTTDWRADPCLRMCSMAARGLWIEMICLMHEASPYGHLLVGGKSPTDAQLAALVGASPDEIAALLGELEAAGVFSRAKQGVIYSRKLTRMAKKAATARNNGRKGGNPNLGKDNGNPASDNPQDKGEDKPQIPDTRYQMITDANASDAERVFWEKAVAYLMKSGVTERNGRSFIGKTIRDHGFDRTRDAFNAARAAGTGDPIPYIAAALKPSATMDAVWAHIMRDN